MNAKIIRISVYGIALILFGLAVVTRIDSVNRDRSADKNNFYSFNQTQGKPVEVIKAKRGQMSVGIKLSVIANGAMNLETYVTGEKRRILKVGQRLKSYSDEVFFTGIISKVSQKVDLDTGMYRIGIKKFKNIKVSKSKVVVPVGVETKRYRNVFSIPRFAVFKYSGKEFVWKVVDGVALRQQIKTSESNPWEFLVVRGLKSGDAVVTSGWRGLKEKQKVNIVKQIVRESL